MTGKCIFCEIKENELVLKEYKYWSLVLAESQFLIGWSHAILKRHAERFEELTDEELIELKQVIKELKSALKKTFNPDWFNVMQLGNMTKHIHFQLVPRYCKHRNFDGRVFVDEDYGNMVVNRWKKEDKKFLLKLKECISNAF